MRSYKLRCKECRNCFQANIRVECTSEVAQNTEIKCSKCNNTFLIKDGNREYGRYKSLITRNKNTAIRLKKEEENFKKAKVYFDNYLNDIDDIFKDLDANNYIDFKFQVSSEYWKEPSSY